MASHDQGGPSPLDPASWARKTLKELKTLCSKHHLPTSHRRADLIEQLEAHFAAQRALSENGGNDPQDIPASSTVPSKGPPVRVTGWEQPKTRGGSREASIPVSTTHLEDANPFAALTTQDSAQRPLLAAKRTTGQVSATSHLSRLRSACSNATARHSRQVCSEPSPSVKTSGNPLPALDGGRVVSVLPPTRTRRRQAPTRRRGARRTESMSPEPKALRTRAPPPDLDCDDDRERQSTDKDFEAHDQTPKPDKSSAEAPNPDKPSDHAPNPEDSSDQAPSVQEANDQALPNPLPRDQDSPVQGSTVQAPEDANPPASTPLIEDDTTMADAPPKPGAPDIDIPVLPVYSAGEPLPSITEWANLSAEALEHLCQAHGLPGSHRWSKTALAEHLRRAGVPRHVLATALATFPPKVARHVRDALRKQREALDATLRSADATANDDDDGQLRGGPLSAPNDNGSGPLPSLINAQTQTSTKSKPSKLSTPTERSTQSKTPATAPPNGETPPPSPRNFVPNFLRPNGQLPSYAAIARGVRSSTCTPIGTAPLCAVLDRAITALKAVIDASHAGTDGQCAVQTTLRELAALADPAVRELVAAQAGLAAANALDGGAARSAAPPPSPDISAGPDAQSPPAARSVAVKAAAAWEPSRCIVLEPPDDRHRRQPTDLHRMGRLVEAAVRSSLKLGSEPALEMLRRTARGGYTAQFFASVSPRVRALSALDLGAPGRWQCAPLRNASRPSAGREGNTVVRRDSFVVANVPDSIPESQLLEVFSASNADRLRSSPASLRGRLRSANRLQRRLASGPNAGKWVPSRSVRFCGDPELVAGVIELGFAVLDFRVLEVRPFSVPARQCYHCGGIGHMAKHCRSKCPSCGSRHPTRECPLRKRGPAASGAGTGGEQLGRERRTENFGSQSLRGTGSSRAPN